MHVPIDPSTLEPAERHKLTIGTIVPRPIAWTSTIDSGGHLNLAPFSYFMGCHSYLPALAISVGSREGVPKDTRSNIATTGEFVVNLVSEELAERMNITAAAFPADISELHVAGLSAVPSKLVGPPRIGECPVAMECRVLHAIDLGEAPRVSTVFIAQIVMWHIRSDLIDEGYRVDQAGIGAVARMGGPLYTRANDIFRMDIPDWQRVPMPDGARRATLEPPAGPEGEQD